MTVARLMAGCGPSFPWWAGGVGAFHLAGTGWVWLWRGAQRADLGPGQDEVGLVGVVVAQANQAGGRDNVTVLIVRFDPKASNHV